MTSALEFEGGASAAAAVVSLYERLADRYISDRQRGAWDERPWLDRFVAHVPPPRRVLDLGCGAGAPVGEYLLRQGCLLTGVDSSPTLIARCQRSFPAATWRVADMRGLALGETFDGLVAWDSLFHLTPEAQGRMFGILQTHAAPGAALIFTSGPRHGVSIGTYHGEPLYHASLDPAEYENLLAEHGFGVLAYSAEDPLCGEHTVWLAKRLDGPG